MNSQHNFLRISVIASTLILCSSLASAQAPSADTPPAQKPDAFQVNLPKPEEKKPVVLPDRKLTNAGKMDVIRGMPAEMGFARKPFPFGKIGLTLKDGK